MQANRINGWREVLARVFAGFEAEYGLTPEWLINPDTNRRLKLDNFFPEISLAIRFVGLQGSQQRQRKSDEEIAAEEQREQQRAAVCREHGVVLVSIDPDGDPQAALRKLEMGLARASAQVATGTLPHGRKQALMPKLSEARQRVGEFTTRLASPEKLNLYAEMWWDRQAALAAETPRLAPAGRQKPFRAGMQVEHERFGLGQVVAVQPEDGDTQVVVQFTDGSQRSFYASLVAGSKLVILDG